MLQGQAGVYRVASELMMRGMLPCMPTTDMHGVDLILESGIRIQVKTACLTTYPGKYVKPLYRFSLGRVIFSTALGRPKNSARNYSNTTDFVVLWGADDNRFWIVPSHILDGRHSVALGTEPWYRDLDIDKAWELKRQGRSQESIAAELGVHQATLSRRLRGKIGPPKQILAQQVRPFESAWHLIREAELQRQPQGKLIEMPAVEAVAS